MRKPQIVESQVAVPQEVSLLPTPFLFFLLRSCLAGSVREGIRLRDGLLIWPYYLAQYIEEYCYSSVL